MASEREIEAASYAFYLKYRNETKGKPIKYNKDEAIAIEGRCIIAALEAAEKVREEK